jgi:hypothetical protein
MYARRRIYLIGHPIDAMGMPTGRLAASRAIEALYRVAH